ncbi:unnamed protein product, partial [Discosporangium mesarthrocarpum]
RDGFLWAARPYLRAWDRGAAGVAERSSGEPSGRLVGGLVLVRRALEIASSSLPQSEFLTFWVGLAGELDRSISEQLVSRRNSFSEEEGTQLRVDVEALFELFSPWARRKAETYFPTLKEAVLLLSLPQPKLVSLARALDALGATLDSKGKDTIQ